MVQNVQSKLWDRTGVVVEAKDYRQYLVRLDGSGRVSLRTQAHLHAAPRQDGVVPASSASGSHGPDAPPTPAPAQPPTPPTRPGRRSRKAPRYLEDYVK